MCALHNQRQYGKWREIAQRQFRRDLCKHRLESGSGRKKAIDNIWKIKDLMSTDEISANYHVQYIFLLFFGLVSTVLSLHWFKCTSELHLSDSNLPQSLAGVNNWIMLFVKMFEVYKWLLLTYFLEHDVQYVVHIKLQNMTTCDSFDLHQIINTHFKAIAKTCTYLILWFGHTICCSENLHMVIYMSYWQFCHSILKQSFLKKMFHVSFPQINIITLVCNRLQKKQT